MLHSTSCCVKPEKVASTENRGTQADDLQTSNDTSQDDDVMEGDIGQSDISPRRFSLSKKGGTGTCLYN